MIAPGTLAAEAAARRRSSLASGALQPIVADEERIEDEGVSFVLHRVSGRDPKRLAAAAGAKGVNPFLPPDPALVVAELSPTHLAVLNKFPVLDDHLLLVTRAYVDQEVLLDAADCAALALGLAEIDGLAFYNGGRMAGASQPHKHMQLVRPPLQGGRRPPRSEPEASEVQLQGGRRPPRSEPEASEVEAAVDGAGAFAIPMEARLRGGDALPFAHAFTALDPALFERRDAAGPLLLDAYYALLAAAGLHVVAGPDGPRASAPYNLLATRRWMFVVPRRAGRFEGLAVNALGFAGSLFARGDAEREALVRCGPMNVLRAVAGVAPATGSAKAVG
ncbi:MAG: phosphorylase [Proteobacteria bacterium]|nr:MAG: phosphorylase [Pseudomonadota bacterium]